MSAVRRRARVTQAAAAEAIGVSPTHLSHIESGRDKPSPAIVTYYEHLSGDQGQIWAAYLQLVTAGPERAPLPGAPRYPLPGDASRFVRDVTVPDGTVFAPGECFIKTWSIQNAGRIPWRSRWLARVGATVGHGLPASPPRARIPDADPGAIIEVTFEMRAHYLPGSAQMLFKMVDEDNNEFFPRQYPQGLICAITVRALD